MSWLVSSIANSLKLDDDDDDDYHPKTINPSATTTAGENSNDVDDDQRIHSRLMTSSNPSSPSDQISPSQPRGVKEDLSELSKTLTRQFWGVASFLAPPPQPQISDRDARSEEESDPNSSDPAGIVGIRNDLSEIGGKFRSGISKLSSNKAVSEFTKIASNLMKMAAEEGLSVEDYAQRGVVGVTEEVVAFARDVAMHPETWLDFPLPDDDDDDNDFDLSDAQQEHALAVERLAPELGALRNELCLGYISEACFWKIYFVLVHPRLSKHDAEILSTPEIVKARAMLTQDLHSRGKSRPYYESETKNVSADTSSEMSHEQHLCVPVIDQSESIPVEISAVEPPPSSVYPDIEMDKHPVTTTEIPVIDKTVVEEEVSTKQTNIEKPTSSTSKSVDQKDDDDVDDWLQEEENTEDGTTFKETSYPLGTDDDVSFSDLEEDEDVPTTSKKAVQPKSSAKESSDWVQLADSAKDVNTRSESNKVSSHTTLENKESNDWLDVEDIDVA